MGEFLMSSLKEFEKFELKFIDNINELTRKEYKKYIKILEDEIL